MKKKLLILIITALWVSNKSTAQTRNVGPVEQKVTTALCDCLNKIDLSKITNKKEANDAFMGCFMNQSNFFVDLAAERNIAMTDNAAMHELGLDIGKNLLNQKCDAFLKLAAKTADHRGEPETEITTGSFKRIDTKGFNYIIITDASGSEKSFLWLRQFTGSEKFMAQPLNVTGKKLKITWQELEVYLPQAKGYYKLKEIMAIDIL
jgi:hypothetical protein